MSSDQIGRSMDEAWDSLHRHSRFRPRYPSESVVRFLARSVGWVVEGMQPATVLDYGCGAGRHSRLVTEMGHRLVATDYSAEGLRHARVLVGDSRAPAIFTQFVMGGLPVRNGSIDAAIAMGVLLYNDAAGFRAAAAEIHDALRDGGRAVVVTRTTDDHRFGRGQQIEPATFLLRDDTTNEAGMPMHFLDRESIDEVFSGFHDITVDRVDHSAGGGAILNSDWVIELLKR